MTIGADIDLTGKTWTPLTRWIGTLEGNGKTISGITYSDNTTTDNVGIIANIVANGNNIKGTIQNLTLKNCSISSTSAEKVGALTGMADRGRLLNNTIENCTVTATKKAGALAGRTSYASDDVDGVPTLLITGNKVVSCTVTSSDANYAGAMIGLIRSDNNTYDISNTYVYITTVNGTVASTVEDVYGAAEDAVLKGTDTVTVVAKEEAPSIPLTNGMQVVIYNPANKKALSSQPASAGSYYQKGVNVTLADGKLTGFADTEIWTVVANEDGTYSFEQGGKKIAMQDSFSSMSLGAANDKWEVIALGDGLFNIKNVKRGNFIEWYASKNNWSTYTSSNAATDPLFQLAFFEVVETEEPACEHKNTEVVGAKDATETEEGYTGDTVCKDCGTVVAVGEKIPVIVNDPAADSTLTIAEALALGASKAHNTYTAGKYYVVGEITEVYNTQYGNMKIKDAEGNILTIYGTYSADGSTRYDSLEVKPVAGDTVKIYGIVGQFNGTAQIKNGWIVEHTPAVCEHANTEIVGAKEATETEEGYTGDKVCTKCGETVEKGTTIPVKTPETVEPAPTGDAMIVVVAAVLLAGAAIALISRKRRFN